VAGHVERTEKFIILDHYFGRFSSLLLPLRFIEGISSTRTLLCIQECAHIETLNVLRKVMEVLSITKSSHAAHEVKAYWCVDSVRPHVSTRKLLNGF
jgi:hypothetical protein